MDNQSKLPIIIETHASGTYETYNISLEINNQYDDLEIDSVLSNTGVISATTNQDTIIMLNINPKIKKVEIDK
jgi:hypothetical protein